MVRRLEQQLAQAFDRVVEARGRLGVDLRTAAQATRLRSVYP